MYLHIVVGAIILGSGCSKIEDGLKIELYNSGKLKEKTYYKDGLRNGPFTQFYTTGEVMAEGFYKDGKLEGTYISFYAFEDYPAGKIKERGNFNSGNKEGLWYREGSETTWFDGNPEGPIIKYNGRYKKSIKIYEKGLRHGKWVYFDPLGREDTYEVWEHGKRIRFEVVKEE